MSVERPTPGAGVVCLRGGQVLLVKRGKPPRMGEWSIPGGRMEMGETIAETALRELVEETRVSAELLGLIDVVDTISERGQMVLIDYAARWVSGEPVAGDDAAEARFFPIDEALAIVGWDQTRRIIEDAVTRFGERAG